MAKPDNVELKRKAWVYTPEPLPNIAELFAGKERRDRFLTYWLKESPRDFVDIAFHFAFKLLPSHLASRLGAMLGKKLMPRLYPSANKRAKATIARLRPDLSKEEQQALLIANQEAQGRLLTEISVITRLKHDQSPVIMHGMDHFYRAQAEGPIISLGMHVSNWEVAPAIFTAAGFAPYVNYVPPKERGKSWIISRVRRISGVDFLPPGIEGIRPAINVLKQGGLVSVFCDEGFEGKIRGPFFDCEPHLHGNIAHVARLARMSGATLCPWYCRRTGDFTFELHALDPIKLPTGPKTPQQVWDDVALINATLEPVILANLDQWYFLDNKLGPKKKR